MKRTIPVLAAVAGVLGATLTGTAPASAAGAVDCSSPEYTRVLETYIPTNIQRPAVDGRQYNINGPDAFTYQVCVDIPDTSTFTIEVRDWAPNGGPQTVWIDDRPGDKVFRFPAGANHFWQVYGTMTGPGSTYITYKWAEKRLPA